MHKRRCYMYNMYLYIKNTSSMHMAYEWRYIYTYNLIVELNNIINSISNN